MNSKIKRMGSKNAWVHHYENGALVLRSYATPVACYIPGLGFMETEQKWSQTTTKQISQWKRDHGYPLTARVPQEELNNWLQKLDGLKFGETQCSTQKQK